MLTLFASLGVWDWFIAGGLLLVLEVLAPGVFMLWLGLAAMLVGAISMFVDWTWQAQFFAFAVFSVAALPLWLRLSKQVGTTTHHPILNPPAETPVGPTFTFGKPTPDGARPT